MPFDRAALVYLGMVGADYQVTRYWEYGIERKPVLGFQYLAAALRPEGVETDVWDLTLEPFSARDLLAAARERRWGFVGFYSATSMKPRILDWLRRLRAARPDLPLLVGGPGYFAAEAYLKAGADVVVRGEGERAIVELAEWIRGERTLGSVLGVSYLKDGRLQENPDRPAVEDLDDLPFPVRPRESVAKYHDWHIFGMRKPYITMVTSRGCPFDCTFCTSPAIWGHKIRRRSVANVLAEIDREVAASGVRYIGFKDDVFGTSVEWTREFCEKLLARPYKVRWSAMVHPFSFRKERDWMIPLMARAGLDILIPGLQSVDARVLENISRDPREPYELAEMLGIARRAGVSTVLQFIFGLPGDSEETMEAALKYALAVKPNYAQFYRLSFLEGAEMERRFPRQDPTEFPPEEIERRVARAQRRFYLNPGVLGRNLAHVLRKNPRWLLVALRHAPYILAAAGLPIGEKADPC